MGERRRRKGAKKREGDTQNLTQQRYVMRRKEGKIPRLRMESQKSYILAAFHKARC